MLDTRLIGKPNEFNGDDAKWSDFQYVMMSYCGLLYAQLPEWMDASRNSPVPVLHSADANERHHGTVLYHLLVMLCKGKALSTIKLCPVNNGYEAWRLLCVKYLSLIPI